MIGPWYDPIEGRWHAPRPVQPERRVETIVDEVQEGYRLAHERAIWEAVTATAEASRRANRDEHLAADQAAPFSG